MFQADRYGNRLVTRLAGVSALLRFDPFAREARHPLISCCSLPASSEDANDNGAHLTPQFGSHLKGKPNPELYGRKSAHMRMTPFCSNHTFPGIQQMWRCLHVVGLIRDGGPNSFRIGFILRSMFSLRALKSADAVMGAQHALVSLSTCCWCRRNRSTAFCI